MTGPFPRDGDYAAFRKLLEEKPCKGKPDSAAHQYIEPLDRREWSCAICGTTGPYDARLKPVSEDVCTAVHRVLEQLIADEKISVNDARCVLGLKPFTAMAGDEEA